jgi:hypothetical protein
MTILNFNMLCYDLLNFASAHSDEFLDALH